MQFIQSSKVSCRGFVGLSENDFSSVLWQEGEGRDIKKGRESVCLSSYFSVYLLEPLCMYFPFRDFRAQC